MRLYKLSDRIIVKIKDISIKLSPLTFEQKTEVLEVLAKFSKSQSIKDLLESSRLAMKYSLKEISGVLLEDGSEYCLSFEEGLLSNECLEDIMNCEYNSEIIAACSALINGVPSQIVDQEGKPLVGVSIENPLVERKK